MAENDFKLVGDVRELLRARLSGTHRIATYYGGGAQMGAGMLGLSLALQRSAFANNAPRIVVGSSIGAINGLLDVYGIARKVARFWPTEFCSDEFLSRTFQALRNNRVIRLSKLQKRLVQQLSDSRGDIPHEYYVGTTDFETGEHTIHACDLRDTIATTEAAIGSCSAPAITRPGRMVNGRKVTDGDIGDPLPIHKILELEPSAILIVLPSQWSWMDRNFWVPFQNWVVSRMSNDTLHPTVKKQLYSRVQRFQTTLEWIGQQLALPSDSAERVLPPTCIAYCCFETDPLQTDGRKIARAIGASSYHWRKAFGEVLGRNVL